MEKNAARPMGLADATLVALAEEWASSMPTSTSTDATGGKVRDRSRPVD
jgi:hypothetical protein